MITAVLAREQRRAKMATSACEIPERPTLCRLEVVCRQSNSKNADPLASDAMDRWGQTLKIVRHHATKDREQFPHYYPIYRGSSQLCTSIVDVGALVGAKVFSNQGGGGCTTAVVAVVDGVRISAILMVALMIRALLAITTRLPGITGNREWPKLSSHRARYQDYRPVLWPFTPSAPPGPSRLHGTMFSTPRIAASLISVGERDQRKNSFTK
jgi:hypothetical protein